MSKQNLKALALAPMAGFRKKEVTVPEWENAKVIIREPSAEAWIRWQGIASPEQPKLPEGQEAPEVPELTPSERAFSRLLKQALDLIRDADDAKAK
ncbi:phage tail assembly chaperone [Klebsiella michiganensis]|uniref:phage tail assembly chaperone n=1 Tax=Klebsiella michiganensis TaxID=1134687 RepID=UPI001F14ECEC|nr:phage tail assembly chaperone [Klebsiella michiganensis]